MATFYIDTAGVDDAGRSGGVGQEWLTLSYACSRVTTTGNTIYVNAGTFTETVQSDLRVGVTIVGTGDTSIITSSSALNPMIELLSAAEGTDGNQSISYLKLDGGNLAGTRAIYVYLRKNVSVHDVTVEDFSGQGIHFRGSIADSPVIYATGNSIYNCTLTNTCGRGGAITFRGQDGILVHDNILTGYQRTVGHDLTLVSGNVNKAVIFYNNKLYLDDVIFGVGDPAGASTMWNFGWENWDSGGGFQVYDNEFHGGHCAIDVGGTYNIKGIYNYSWDIHDNLFEWSAQYPTQLDPSFDGITFEGGVADLIIRNNHFKNLPCGILSSIMQSPRIHENITISYNIMENMGWGNDTWCWGISIGQGSGIYGTDAITRNINIFNNVINSGTGTEGSLTGGIILWPSNLITNINIKNNIIQNVVGYGCIVFWDWDGGHTIDAIDIQNNIWYNNVNANDFYTYAGTVVTNLVNSGNIEDNPDFVTPASDFHLQAGSPAINTGLDVGLTTDYDNQAVSNPPEIGAYERQIIYYIATDGNDTNPGTLVAPWATIAKVNSVALFPGDSILFNRGDTWREILTVDNGSAAGRIYYGAYGTGNKPLLLNSVNALTGWTNLGSNIWQNTNAAFSRKVGFLIFNNEESIGSNKYTEAELTEQGDFWHDYNNDLVKMYSVSDPATYYTVIEASLGSVVGGGSIGEATVSISNNSYITFENLDFRYSGQGTIYCFYSHDITVRSCDFSFNGGCFWHPETNNQRIGGGTGCYGATGYDVYNMIFEKNRLWNEYEGTLSASGGDGTYSMHDIAFTNNLVGYSELGIEYWVGAGATAYDIYFVNNTFIRMGGGMAHFERPSVRGYGIAIYTSLATESNVFIRNNIFYGCTEAMVYFEVTNDVNDIVIDYNVYYPLTATNFAKISGYTYNTFATWQTNPYGAQDAHSIEDDPDFVSASDFHLQSSSPAINAGLNVGLTTDYDGNPIVGLPDIGALEYQNIPVYCAILKARICNFFTG